MLLALTRPKRPEGLGTRLARVAHEVYHLERADVRHLLAAAGSDTVRSGLVVPGAHAAEVHVSTPDVVRGQPSVQDTGQMEGQDELAQLLSAFARSAEEADDPQATLAQITRAAVDLVPGCDEASISVVLGRRQVTSQAATGEMPRAVDALQDRIHQGPCLDAAYQNATVRVANMATEARWPLFTPAALEAGAVGMLSFQLYVKGDDLGALNLFSRQAGAFTDESEHVGLMFAAHAAIAYAAARKEERMVRGLLTQQVIGQAQGILMERHKITADRAFAVLVRASQHSNIKLRDLAARLVTNGELPGALPGNAQDRPDSR